MERSRVACRPLLTLFHPLTLSALLLFLSGGENYRQPARLLTLFIHIIAVLSYAYRIAV